MTFSFYCYRNTEYKNAPGNSSWQTSVYTSSPYEMWWVIYWNSENLGSTLFTPKTSCIQLLLICLIDIFYLEGFSVGT